MVRSRRGILAVGQWALLLAPAAALAGFGWARRWMADDAFIDLRVVAHLLAGYGPVFNIGERVEAYTSPLWVGMLAAAGALAHRLGSEAPLEWLAACLGLGCAVFGLAAATLGATIGARRAGHYGLALPLGALVVAAIPAYWDFATSGLETGLLVAWLGACYWSVAHVLTGSRSSRLKEVGWSACSANCEPVSSPERRLSCFAAVLIGFGPLIRPDLAVISAGFLLLLLVGQPARGWRRAAGLLLAAGLLPALYQVFRMGYFAAVAPNTALAKEAGVARWDQGWRYLEDFVGPYWLWVPALPLGAWWLFDLAGRLRRRTWRGAALVGVPIAAGLLHGLYIVRLGGDFMHGRMLLPSFLALLLPVAAIAGTRWWQAVLPAGVVVPWAVATILWLHPPYHAVGNNVGPQGIADERGFYVWFSHHPHPVTLVDYRAADWAQAGDALRQRAAHERTLLVGIDPAPEEGAAAPRTLPLAKWVPEDGVADRRSVGMLGYAAGLRVRVIDRFGLADPVGSRLRLERRSRPGHEKLLPEAWVIARYAAPEMLDTSSPQWPQIAAARAAVRCGDLAALLDAIQEPLSPGRFVHNVALAWRLSDLRLAAEPLQAQRELCP